MSDPKANGSSLLVAPYDRRGGDGQGGSNDGGDGGDGGARGPRSWPMERGNVIWRLGQNESRYDKLDKEIREELRQHRESHDKGIDKIWERIEDLGKEMKATREWLVGVASKAGLYAAIANGLAILGGLWLAWRGGK